MKMVFINKNFELGGMLVELMMTIALAALIIPFVFKYQQNAVIRAKNIAVTKQVEYVQNALEKYIIENKNILMKPLGKNITRVQIEELINYGLAENIVNMYANEYQLRILKTNDQNDKSTLQGIVVFANNDVTPVRTREIVNLGGGKIGFIEGNSTYGGYGVFHSNTAEYGIQETKGIISSTSVVRGNTEYLWRLPSENVKDATMESPLNLGWHDIVDISSVYANNAKFEEKLKLGEAIVNNVTFGNRTTVDTSFSTNTAVVSGMLTSDSRELNVTDMLSLSDIAKLSSFEANDLYVNNLVLSGLSIDNDEKASVLRIVENLDVVAGSINAMYVTIGYTGSITPRLVVTNKIQDTSNSNYYWDVNNGVGHLLDVRFPDLSRMAKIVIKTESKQGTVSTNLFGGVAANQNATVSDYLNAITEIQKKVRNKYQILNLK